MFQNMSLRKKILIGVASIVVLLSTVVFHTMMFKLLTEDNHYDPIRIPQSESSSPAESPSPEEENLWAPSRDVPLGDDPETAPAPVNTNCWGCGPVQ